MSAGHVWSPCGHLVALDDDGRGRCEVDGAVVESLSERDAAAGPLGRKTDRRAQDSPLDLVGPMEVAARLGVALSTVHQWCWRKVMPEPEWQVSGTRVWRWEVVERWSRETRHPRAR